AVGALDAPAVLGDPSVATGRVHQPVADREGATSSEGVANLVGYASTVFDAHERIKGPHVLSGEVTRRVAGQRLDVVADEKHRPGLVVHASVHGAGDVEDDGPKRLFAPMLGLPGGHRRRVIHRADIHQENCRREVRELKPYAPEIRKKVVFSIRVQNHARRPAADDALLEQKTRKRAVGVLGPPGEHRLGITEDPRGVLDLCAPGRVGREVIAPPRAVAELDISRVFESPYGEVVPLEMPVPRPIEGTIGKAQVAPVEFPTRGRAPPRRTTPLKQWRQRQAVALGGNLDPERLADRREEVDVLGERFDGSALHHPGTAHDAGHAVALLEISELFLKPMVAELLAVIGGKDYERVLEL